MPAMDKSIQDFIRKHHVMTLATLSGGAPHCSNLFYAWDGTQFVVTSEASTQHAQDVLVNSTVASSIVLETHAVGKIQGLQLRGVMFRPTGPELAQAKKTYLKAFPFAIFMNLDLWIITPTHAKLTDNRLGFGKKLVWTKE